MASRWFVTLSWLVMLYFIVYCQVLGVAYGKENVQKKNSTLQKDVDLFTTLAHADLGKKSPSYSKRDTSLFTTRCRPIRRICPMMRGGRCARLCVDGQMRHVCKVRLSRSGPWTCVYLGRRHGN